jgi:energy-coupling factor transporter ATP-binding protein EcfA2
MSLIEFSNFHFRYKGIEEYAINNINLEIDLGKFILLAGQTGSGKTTLIRCMNGLIPQFYAGFYKGTVKVNGKDTSKIPIADLSTEVGIVFQNPENQLIAMNVEHELSFGLENLGIPKDIIRKRIYDAAGLTNIEHLMEKAPFELSGGEQQRVALASIIALEPKILVLDEPTALLDPRMAKNIIELLAKIKNERDITIIISEHRLDLLLPIVDEIILINDGKILECGDKDKVVNGKNFEKLHINHPFIYDVFNSLKNKNLYDDMIPTSPQLATNALRKLLKK